MESESNGTRLYLHLPSRLHTLPLLHLGPAYAQDRAHEQHPAADGATRRGLQSRCKRARLLPTRWLKLSRRDSLLRMGRVAGAFGTGGAATLSALRGRAQLLAW